MEGRFYPSAFPHAQPARTKRKRGREPYIRRLKQASQKSLAKAGGADLVLLILIVTVVLQQLYLVQGKFLFALR